MAIAKAKMMFKKVHNRIPAEEVNKWSTEEFLSKCELMLDGKLRRAAIILLGKMFSDSKLRPAVAEVTWTLRDEKKDVVDYEHFSVPFIMTVDEILAKIHNLTLREMPGGTLFPDTMKQYDDYTIREALHNASPIRIIPSSSVSIWWRIPASSIMQTVVRSFPAHWRTHWRRKVLSVSSAIHACVARWCISI